MYTILPNNSCKSARSKSSECELIIKICEMLAIYSGYRKDRHAERKKKEGNTERVIVVWVSQESICLGALERFHALINSAVQKGRERDREIEKERAWGWISRVNKTKRTHKSSRKDDSAVRSRLELQSLMWVKVLIALQAKTCSTHCEWNGRSWTGTETLLQEFLQARVLTLHFSCTPTHISTGLPWGHS